MPPKKKWNSKAGKSRRRRDSGVTELLIRGGELPPLPGERTSSNGTQYEHQILRNPYVPGEREKMLEKREKLTLEAFRIAYENHHRS